jgi:Tfp pilus assembly protein PilF
MTGRFSKLEPRADAAQLQPSTALPGEPTRDASTYFDLATAAMHAGLHESALQQFTRSLREDRSRIPAWVGQLQMLLELHEHAEAQLWAAKALEVFRANGDLLACASQAALRIGDRSGALAQSDLSLKATGSSPLRWIARGEVLLTTRPALAGECFAKAMTEEHACWFDLVRIARVHLAHSRHSPAADFAQRAVEAAPDKPFAWETLAVCHQGLGLNARAAECFRHAAQLAPGRADYARRRAEAERAGTSLFARIKRTFSR